MVERIGIFIVLICGGLGWASDYLGLPWLASIAIILFGLGVIAWGVEVVIKGEVTLINSEHRRYEFFSGIPAGLWSAIFILSGMGILYLGWLDLTTPQGSEKFFERVLNTPAGWGVILGFAGSILLAAGVIRVLSGSAALHDKPGLIEELGFRLGGILKSLTGAGLLLLAAGLVFAPELLNSLVERLVSSIKDWLNNP